MTGELVPAFYHILQPSLFPSPAAWESASSLSQPIFPFPSWLLEKIRNLATAPPLSTLWAGMLGDIVEDWKSIEFLPSASWTERRSKDQCVSLLLLSLALPSQVPSCRNQSVHTCLPSYPGGGEIIPHPVLPHPGPLHTPKTPHHVSPSPTACVRPFVLPPDPP